MGKLDSWKFWCTRAVRRDVNGEHNKDCHAHRASTYLDVKNGLSLGSHCKNTARALPYHVGWNISLYRIEISRPY